MISQFPLVSKVRYQHSPIDFTYFLILLDREVVVQVLGGGDVKNLPLFPPRESRAFHLGTCDRGVCAVINSILYAVLSVGVFPLPNNKYG